MSVTQNPVFYDSSLGVFRPMDSGALIPTTALPISATDGNVIQNLSDGLYVGQYTGLVLFVNANAGSDSNPPGQIGQPFQTLAHTFSVLNGLFANGQFTGNVIVALAAGQTYTWNADFVIYGGNIEFTFYGDPTYGNYNSAYVAGTTAPWWMGTTLERPIIAPTSYTNTGGQNMMYGIDRFGGNVSFAGVQINLPAAPSSPNITNYGSNSDFVRNWINPVIGEVSMVGTICNMTDIGGFWGFMGMLARSITFFSQAASQFLVNGIEMSSANNPTSAQLAKRQYFLKFYPDYAGNNQTQTWLSGTSSNSSTGSGILFCSWSDTEALVVTGSATNLGTFPPSFLSGYGLINYIYNLNTTANGQPLNFLNTRIM
jgi:hypothetical protein